MPIEDYFEELRDFNITVVNKKVPRDDMELLNFLKENYNEIYEAMCEEEYTIQYTKYVYFSEIKYEDKVVGFYTIVPSMLMNQFAVNEFYIMPSYRGKNIFAKTIELLLLLFGKDLMLCNPPKHVMLSLIKNDLAVKVSDNLVYSYVRLLGDSYGDIIINDKIKKYYDPDRLEEPSYFADIYDLDYSSIISVDNSHLVGVDKGTVLYAMPRHSDIIKYNLENKISNLDMPYMNTYKKVFLENRKVLLDFGDRKELEYKNFLSVNNLIGTKNKLKNKTKKVLIENNLTVNNGFRIRKKIIEALKEEEITPFNIIKRFYYLVENPSKNAVLTGDEPMQLDYCPYCAEKIEQDFYCSNCGFDFGYNNYNLDIDDNLNKINDILDEIDIDDLFVVDDETGLEVEFLDEILEKGYDPDEVYSSQLELAVNNVLSEIDIEPNYQAFPFTEKFHIEEEPIISFMLDKKLVEKRENHRYDEYALDNITSVYDLPEYNILDEYIYKITKKGRRYYKQNKTASKFNEMFKNLDYYEFKTFINKSDKRFDDSVNDYIDYKTEKIINDNDAKSYTVITYSKALNMESKEEDINLFTSLFLKSFICNLNLHTLQDDIDWLFDFEDIMELRLGILNQLIEKEDFTKLYNEAYEEIELEQLKFNKEENYDIIFNKMKNKGNELLKSDSFEDYLGL